jgi:hypothetical protein
MGYDTAQDRPGGTATFLLTGVEVAGLLWELAHDAVAAALARHHEPIEAAIRAHGGYVAAQSVTTSTGATFVVAMACSKNRRAALASLCGDTSTSMTCPNWSIAR